VALARALVNQPSVLLLDEPLGALDLKLREQMQVELKSIQRQVGITFIYVTHDQGEALSMSDRVAVFNQGKIEQIGTPAEIYDHPASPFVYQFIGNSNRFECDVARGQVLIGGQSFGGTGDVYPDGPALAFVRPHDLEIRSAGSGFGIPATVRQVFTAGNLLRVELDVNDGRQIVEVELDRSRNIGDLSTGRDVLLMPQRIKLFPRSGAEIPAAAPIRRLTQAG
jgi:sulfate transport system ATP-binding protein